MSNKNALYEEAIETILQDDIHPNGTPVLFTSCCRPFAEEFVAKHPQYALIHHSPAGEKLDKLDLFSYMPRYVAYLHWFYLSSRYVVENEFPQDVLFFGDLENPSSLAFGIEIPLLYHAAPHVQTISNPLMDQTFHRDHWLKHQLMRPYVLELSNLWVSGQMQDNLLNDGRVLIDSFGESSTGLPLSKDSKDARQELALKLMISGYLGKHGNFPADEKRNYHPLSLALGGS